MGVQPGSQRSLPFPPPALGCGDPAAALEVSVSNRQTDRPTDRRSDRIAAAGVDVAASFAAGLNDRRPTLNDLNDAKAAALLAMDGKTGYTAEAVAEIAALAVLSSLWSDPTDAAAFAVKAIAGEGDLQPEIAACVAAAS